MVHRSGIYYSKINLEKKKLKREQTIYSRPTKYNNSQAPNSAPHIWKGGLGILFAKKTPRHWENKSLP